MVEGREIIRKLVYVRRRDHEGQMSILWDFVEEGRGWDTFSGCFFTFDCYSVLPSFPCSIQVERDTPLMAFSIEHLLGKSGEVKWRMCWFVVLGVLLERGERKAELCRAYKSVRGPPMLLSTSRWFETVEFSIKRWLISVLLPSSLLFSLRPRRYLLFSHRFYYNYFLSLSCALTFSHLPYLQLCSNKESDERCAWERGVGLLTDRQIATKTKKTFGKTRRNMQLICFEFVTYATAATSTPLYSYPSLPFPITNASNHCENSFERRIAFKWESILDRHFDFLCICCAFNQFRREWLEKCKKTTNNRFVSLCSCCCCFN